MANWQKQPHTILVGVVIAIDGNDFHYPATAVSSLSVQIHAPVTCVERITIITADGSILELNVAKLRPRCRIGDKVQLCLASGQHKGMPHVNLLLNLRSDERFGSSQSVTSRPNYLHLSEFSIFFSRIINWMLRIINGGCRRLLAVIVLFHQSNKKQKI